MKTLVLAAMLGLVACGAAVWGDGVATAPTTAPATAPASAFKTEKERIGYAIGLQVGSKLKGMDVDGATLMEGLRDASAGKKPQITEREFQDAMMALQKQMQAARAAAVAENQKAGEAFLAENAKKEGVKTTASGLQYKVTKSGTGKTPKATDSVSVTYRGTFVSGREFDSSEEPVTFQVNHVIPGWTEALQLMKEGDKWTVYVPAKLAYGENGMGEDIGPNETLIFEVTLVAVK